MLTVYQEGLQRDKMWNISLRVYNQWLRKMFAKHFETNATNVMNILKQKMCTSLYKV